MVGLNYYINGENIILRWGWLITSMIKMYYIYGGCNIYGCYYICFLH